MSEIVSKPASTPAQLDDLVRNRWSPRIYDIQHELTHSELESLGESFRWAPSASNGQPWKLILLTRGSELHKSVSALLSGFNAAWAPNAAALAVVMGASLNAKSEELNPKDTAYDLGLATMKMIIQAESMGLKAHPMSGLDKDAVAKTLNSKDYFVMAAVAIGKQASTEGQSEELIARERNPRLRKDDAYLINETL